MAVYLQRGVEDFVRGGEFGVGYMLWDKMEEVIEGS